MYGSCRCKNIEIHWQSVDLSLAPRACQCSYCRAKNAAYVSKPGSRIDVKIHKEAFYQTVHQGSKTADFHECTHCGDLVLVTATIDGDSYGALNVNCLQNKSRFPSPVKMSFDEQSGSQKQLRWQDNWCCPVTFIFDGSTSQQTSIENDQ